MKKIKNILGATINNIIVAFIFIVIICVAIRLSIGDQLMQAIALINLVSVSDKNNNTENEAIKIDLENKNLTHYPAWGEKYGTLSIDSINVKLGLYYGDSLSILRKGVGQSVSYFPGEGGSIICMAHDTGGFLKYLYTVNVGDKIKIKTEDKAKSIWYNKKTVAETETTNFDNWTIDNNLKILREIQNRHLNVNLKTVNRNRIAKRFWTGCKHF